MISAKKFLMCVPVLCTLALYTPGAAAQSAPQPDEDRGRPLRESLNGQAKSAYDSATLLVVNHDFAGALAKFKEAYVASNEPRLLYDMAVCEKNLRHYASMQSLLQRYVREGGWQLSAEDRTTVEAALAAIQSLVATLKITISVDGASVLIDGETVGISPLSDPLAVDLGRHTLTVRKAGFETIERVTDAVGGGEAAISITLTPRTPVSHLTVATDTDASIRIDGQIAGAGRYDGQLSPGTHQVAVTESGKLPYRAEVDLRDGETRTVQVTLESARGGTLWPWIVGGTALVAGAAVGGYFLFKTHDEQGSPPTGALGTVFISSLGGR
jgi:hypothetical protein